MDATKPVAVKKGRSEVLNEVSRQILEPQIEALREKVFKDEGKTLDRKNAPMVEIAPIPKAVGAKPKSINEQLEEFEKLFESEKKK